MNFAKGGVAVMRKVALVLGVMLSVATAHAAERVSLRSLAAEPKSYLDKQIRLPALGCVDDPKGGFVCVEKVGGQMLRIDASALGSATSLKIAERLISDCKGTANLSSAACKLEVEITPRNAFRDTLETADGSLPMVMIYSGVIDMFDPRRR